MNLQKAIKLLNMTPGRTIEEYKKHAEFQLSTFTKKAPLRYKAAASYIINL